MAMPLTHRRFTVDEYHRMAEAGILTEDDRVELLDGEIVEITPIGPRHAAVVARLADRFHRAVGSRAIVWTQNPVRLDRYAEPEPDGALLRPRPDFYADHHPTPDDILLIVEVAQASLPGDRTRKLPAYARAGVPEVWLINLETNLVEVYREPRPDGYAAREILTSADTVTVTALPRIEISVRDILGR